MQVRKKFKFTVIATDIAIFTIKGNKLQVLLIKMKKKPFTDFWACPGGLVKPKESVDQSAKKQLFTKSGVKNVYLEQLYTFGKVNRDPFGRVVSVAYFVLIPLNASLNLKTTEEYAGIDWFPIDKLPRLAYDHQEIIDCAVRRLQAKLTYTNIVYALLSKEFTLTELQNVYEIILNKKIDKRNFRKKIFSSNIVKRIGRKKIGQANRPAELYEFVKRKLQVVEIL